MPCTLKSIETAGTPCRTTRLLTYECGYAADFSMWLEMLLLWFVNRQIATISCPQACPTLRSYSFNENCSQLNTILVPGKDTFTCTSKEDIECVPSLVPDEPFYDEGGGGDEGGGDEGGGDEGGGDEGGGDEGGGDDGGGGISSTTTFDAKIPCPGTVTITVTSCFVGQRAKVTDDDADALQKAAMAFFSSQVLGEGEGWKLKTPPLGCEGGCELACSNWPICPKPKQGADGTWCRDCSWTCSCEPPGEERFAFAPSNRTQATGDAINTPWRPVWGLGLNAVRSFYGAVVAQPELRITVE